MEIAILRQMVIYDFNYEILSYVIASLIKDTIHSVQINSSQTTQVNKNKITLIPVHGLLKNL